MLWKILAMAGLVALGVPAWADEMQVPDKSFEVLQEVFTGVRDDMLDAMDDYWHDGQYERCIAVLRLITTMDPSDVQSWDDGAWMMQNQLRDDEAEAFLLQGLEKNRDRYDMYANLGYYYYMHQRPEESVLYYQQAMMLGAPRITWYRLAHSLEQAGYFYESLNIWLNLEAVETDTPVAGIQIERMISGRPASDMPELAARSREKRKKAAAEKAAGE